MEVGSVVLVREDGLPRMKWSLGVVEKLHEGRDGIPRAVDVRTASGRKTRAVQKLYNLEISNKKTSGSDDDVELSGGVDVVDDLIDRQSEVQAADEIVADAEEVDDGEVLGEVSEEVDGGAVSGEEVVTERRTRVGRKSKMPGRYRDFVLYK